MKVFWYFILFFNLAVVVLSALVLANVIPAEGDVRFSFCLSICLALLACVNIRLENKEEN